MAEKREAMSTTVATTRRRIADDQTLADRLEDIVTNDPVAHKALGALLAASFLLPFGASDLPFALSLEVLGPVAALLVLGLLLALDCRNWAQDQVHYTIYIVSIVLTGRVAQTLMFDN